MFMKVVPALILEIPQTEIRVKSTKQKKEAFASFSCKISLTLGFKKVGYFLYMLFIISSANLSSSSI